MLKRLAELVNDSITINTTIDITNGEVTMMVRITPKAEDAALTGLPPIIISGTPEECEEDFIKFFESPAIADINQTASSVLAFEEAVKNAGEENKAVKENKDKIDSLLKKGEEHLEKDELISAEKIKIELHKLVGSSKNKKFSKFVDDIAKKKAEDGQIDMMAQIEESEIDPDVQTRGRDNRAIEYGISQDQIEIIEQENFDKLEQDGSQSTSEDF